MRYKIFLLVLIISLSISCKGLHQFLFGVTFTDTFSGVEFKYNGWIDDNTFRSTAIGIPDKVATNKRERRISSTNNAQNNAIRYMLDEFARYRHESSGGRTSILICKNKIDNEFYKLIEAENFKVCTNYDDEDNCKCTIEFKLNNLKNKVYNK